MALELALAPHGDVADVARLGSFSRELLPCLVLLAREMGLASIDGVQVDSTQLALELVLFTASGVLLL